MVDTTLNDRKAMPKLTPQAFHVKGFRWQCWLRAQGSWDDMSSNYKTLLSAARDGYIFPTDKASGGLVLHVSRWGALVWRVSIVNAAQTIYSWSARSGDKPWSIVQVRDVAQ